MHELVLSKHWGVGPTAKLWTMLEAILGPRFLALNPSLTKIKPWGERRPNTPGGPGTPCGFAETKVSEQTRGFYVLDWARKKKVETSGTLGEMGTDWQKGGWGQRETKKNLKGKVVPRHFYFQFGQPCVSEGLRGNFFLSGRGKTKSGTRGDRGDEQKTARSPFSHLLFSPFYLPPHLPLLLYLLLSLFTIYPSLFILPL